MNIWSDFTKCTLQRWDTCRWNVATEVGWSESSNINNFDEFVLYIKAYLYVFSSFYYFDIWCGIFWNVVGVFVSTIFSWYNNKCAGIGFHFLFHYAWGFLAFWRVLGIYI